MPGLDTRGDKVVRVSTVKFIYLFLSLKVVFVDFHGRVTGAGLNRTLLFALTVFFLVEAVTRFVFPKDSVRLNIFLTVYALIFLVPTAMGGV